MNSFSFSFPSLLSTLLLLLLSFLYFTGGSLEGAGEDPNSGSCDPPWLRTGNSQFSIEEERPP
jgi:hypothetical protein